MYPLHRLDKATSGILLFALDPDSASVMGKAWENKDIKVEKKYVALVRGWVDIKKLKRDYYTQRNTSKSNYRCWYSAEDLDVENLDDASDPTTFTLNYPLRVQDDKLRVKQTKKVQNAVTTMKVLGKCELPFPCGPYQSVRYSLMELGLQTGRKHQLRQHMHHLNHPIIGDVVHGDLRQNKCFYANVLGDERQLFLRAKCLNFEDPFTGRNVELDAGLGENWRLLAEMVPEFKQFIE